MLAKQYQVYLLKSWNQFGGYSEILNLCVLQALPFSDI